MERWQGRVAIVTGASAGIGAAIAKLLAESGMKVVGFARRKERVEELADQLKTAGCKGELHAFAGDVRSEEDVKRAVQWTRETLGGTDVLVSNAGVVAFGGLTEVSTEDLKKVLDTNLVGACVFMREVVQDMKERGVNDGHIFFINSTAGQAILNFPGTYVYAAGKHALRVVTEGLRRELRDMGTKIRVTSVSPGAVKTEIGLAAGVPKEMVELGYKLSVNLESVDVANAVLYALGTPPHVQVHEITMHPTGEKL
ncbi:farnesol dehydrogenase-like [Neocloeon triangulifer]|uniref:farnesol dehydrogenase-like n=1 Tax=Neocloeon triangulifer TaxID=2078957 RepID=UPI00286EF07A|nr:farnesol dehydrogenase-like [Neocloeon triangulifer]